MSDIRAHYTEAEFDHMLAVEKRRWQAEALREFARSIDLEALAEEWEGPDGTGHWSAGNAASAVQGTAFDRADQIESEEGSDRGIAAHDREAEAQMANAWGEGHKVGWEHHQDGSFGTDWWDDDTPNPYRTAEGTGR